MSSKHVKNGKILSNFKEKVVVKEVTCTTSVDSGFLLK